ncbi:MAG TPA: glycoside hydrolase family 3 protein [Nocardioides sp.]|nr:glycoside hydrolase family 3 protein [Nocardioides sp.]
MSHDPGLRRLASSVVVPGFPGVTVPPWLQQRLEKGLAGVCLFGHNVEHADQVRELTSTLHAVRPGVLITSDEEGGSVTRLDVGSGSPWPAHATLGALDDPAATTRVAAALGARARDLGVDVVLAPVVDVGSEPDNTVIGERSFGADAALVSRHGAAFVRGLQSSGPAACAKHFPGHGATRVDSHVSLPVIDVDEATYRARDLAPFVAAVEAGVRCVMTAHVVVRCLDDRPATMSDTVIAILRDELGFDGVVLSDALDMRAISAGVGRASGAVAALGAGVDLLCIGNPEFPDPYDAEAVLDETINAVERGVADGAVSVSRLEEASARVAGLADSIGPAPAEVLDDAEALRLGTTTARSALSVRGDVRVDGPALVLVARPELSYAAGRRHSVLAELLRRRPDWQVVDVADGDDAAARAAGAAGREVVLVVEGRSTLASGKVVDAVLASAPRAVVVHEDRAPDAARSVRSFGGGAATAHAVSELLGGGA